MFELVLIARAHRAGAVSDVLLAELGSLAISEQDADVRTGAEESIYGEPGSTARAWSRSIVTALFSSELQATRAATLLLAREIGAAIELQSIRLVPDEDWVRLTQSQFAPVEITAGFWIVPSWHRVPADAATVVRLDPGLAFGTGTHPTTRMCLRWIARQAATKSAGWQRVLDYGCGSGILAISAALHGATHVDAVDIDPIAVQITLANAGMNGVALHASSPTVAQGHYALVMANILAAPLALLAPVLCSHLAPGGMLLLAGILDRQAAALQAAYARHCDLQTSDREDGWILMRGRRSA